MEACHQQQHEELAPHGTVGELFVLMLHDRVVELERRLTALEPASVDARIDIVDAPHRSAGTYVRVHSASQVNDDAWAQAVVRRVGSLWACDVDATCCQHYGLDGTFVCEMLLVAANHAARQDARLSVAQAARACLDALVDDCRGTLAPNVAQPVVVCGIASREWFSESIVAANPSGNMWSWDASESAAVHDIHDTWIRDEGWCMLQGWLAHSRERVDVQHPRALHAQIEARRLWSFVTRLS